MTEPLNYANARLEISALEEKNANLTKALLSAREQLRDYTTNLTA